MVAQDLAALAPNTILPDGRGYLVFEIYSLQPQQGAWQVYRKREPVAVMTGLKSAVSWCVADKYQQHALSTEILSLDQHKMMLENNLRVREYLAQKTVCPYQATRSKPS